MQSGSTACRRALVVEGSDCIGLGGDGRINTQDPLTMYSLQQEWKEHPVVGAWARIDVVGSRIGSSAPVRSSIRTAENEVGMNSRHLRTKESASLSKWYEVNHTHVIEIPTYESTRVRLGGSW